MTPLTCQQNFEIRSPVLIRAGSALLPGHLCVPALEKGLVLFVHGSGSGRQCPHDRRIAAALHGAGFGTLLIDLLTKQEMASDLERPQLRFDIELLASRIQHITEWLRFERQTRNLPLGYLGTTTGTAAGLVAAARMPQLIGAIVSRGGRPDMAAQELRRVKAPTLLIVGELDDATLDANRAATTQLQCEKQIKIIPRASHLFEETGALEAVARLAREWFEKHLAASTDEPPKIVSPSRIA